MKRMIAVIADSWKEEILVLMSAIQAIGAHA
jgi:hypothetical protein